MIMLLLFRTLSTVALAFSLVLFFTLSLSNMFKGNTVAVTGLVAEAGDDFHEDGRFSLSKRSLDKRWKIIYF